MCGASPDHAPRAQTAEGPANRPLPFRQLVSVCPDPAAQRRPELFELEFEDEFDELLDELFEDEFELEFDEEFELELELEFDDPLDELLDELFEARCRRASVVATASVSGVATRAWAPSTPTVTSAAVASVVAVIIFFMSLSCCERPSRGRSTGERAGDRFIPALMAGRCGSGRP